jgi:multidrug transporter EmrE-like cation transporter
MSTPVSSIAWVIFGSVVGSLGAAGLKAGAQRLELNFRAVVSNWRLAGGLGLYLLSTAFFIIGLAKGELSVLYPMVSVGYICTLIWSKVLFGEVITRSKIGGIALILVGVALLGLSAHR